MNLRFQCLLSRFGEFIGEDGNDIGDDRLPLLAQCLHRRYGTASGGNEIFNHHHVLARLEISLDTLLSTMLFRLGAHINKRQLHSISHKRRPADGCRRGARDAVRRNVKMLHARRQLFSHEATRLGMRIHHAVIAIDRRLHAARPCKWLRDGYFDRSDIQQKLRDTFRHGHGLTVARASLMLQCMDRALGEQLQRLVTVFLAENEKINLSALRTEAACWNGNVLDSLALLELPSIMDTASTLLDLGTGGGFPLLPLAIARPSLQCTGLDSVGKKVAAVQRIADAMALKNVSTIAGRAEEIGKQKLHRERYDLVTSRAVAPLNMLLEYCAPFVKLNGWIVLWKSLHIEQELTESANAQQVLHCPLTETHRYALPGDWGERQLLLFQKTKALSAEYPREVGMAKKSPL